MIMERRISLQGRPLKHGHCASAGVSEEKQTKALDWPLTFI